MCTYCKVTKRLKSQSKENGVITFGTSEPKDILPHNASEDVHVISMISTENDEHDEFSDSSTSTISKVRRTSLFFKTYLFITILKL